MKQIFTLAFICLLLLSSCSPKISTSILKNYSPLDYREEVHVFNLNDPIPSGSEKIGKIKIGDTGFSTDCNWNTVIEKAKMEARKAGANAIKITSHNLPDLISSCHRIEANLLKVGNITDFTPVTEADSSLINADYALLHVYRQSGSGFLVSYDLYLGDSVICRVSNKFKKTIRISKEGPNTLWARTESKSEIPVNIKFGNEYYLRCGITMGAFVGRPSLELLDSSTGKSEFQAVKSKSKNKSILILNDGQEIECNIPKQENDIIYFTILKDNKEIDTQISKDKVKEIQIND